MANTLSNFEIQTRFLINRFFVEHGHAPSSSDLAVIQGCSEKEVLAAFRQLQNDNKLNLYPNSGEIWIAHPFSAVATNYWIRAGDRGWWGNCGFCALGIAAMLGGDATIKTSAGCEGQTLDIKIRGAEIEPKSSCLHIPMPISRWHDNFIYTCGNVHYFRSEKDVPGWCKRHNVKAGRTLDLEHAWNLAQAWYGNYLMPDWEPRSDVELQYLLNDCGLKGSFWAVETGT